MSHYQKGNPARQKTFFSPILEWIRSHPLRLSLVFFGIALLLFSLNAHAYSNVSASLGESEFWMQPDSHVETPLNVTIHASEPIFISYSIEEPAGFILDGDLLGVERVQGFQHTLTLKVQSGVPEGTYQVQLDVHTSQGGTTQIIPLPITVHVGKPSRVKYFTSSNSTLAPTITQAVVSPTQITMHRSDHAYVHVAFTNQSNATDYSIELGPNPIGIFASVNQPNYSFVQPGQRVQTDVMISVPKNSAFQRVPVSVYARNTITQEKTLLGDFSIDVVPVYHAELHFPVQSVDVPANGQVEVPLTLQNTENNDIQLSLQSSSSVVHVPASIILIPANSSTTISMQVFGASSPETHSETIYAFNRDFSTQISLQVRTVSIPTHAAQETRAMDLHVQNDSAVEWNDITFFARNVPADWIISFPQQHASLLQGDSISVPVEVVVPSKEANGSFDVLVLDNGNVVDTLHLTSNPRPGALSEASGLLGGVSRPLIGAIIVILALLLVFSNDFRQRAQGLLPKPKPPAPAPAAKEVIAQKIQSASTQTETKTVETETKAVPAETQ